MKVGLEISEEKKLFRGSRIEGTIGLFRRNSGYSAEEKFRRIPYRTISRKRKCLEFRSMEQKLKQTLGIMRDEGVGSGEWRVGRREEVGIPSTCILNFYWATIELCVISFPSVPSFRKCSSAELRMPSE